MGERGLERVRHLSVEAFLALGLKGAYSLGPVLAIDTAPVLEDNLLNPSPPRCVQP